jgi:hypothetical protein
MKLVISRSQAAMKGMLGGHKGVRFTLSYRLELTPEEDALVREYKLENYPLTWTTINGSQMPDDTIRSLQQGRNESVDDVTTLIRNEEIVKDACDSLPPLFEVAKSFGGEEVIEYPRGR